MVPTVRVKRTGRCWGERSSPVAASAAQSQVNGCRPSIAMISIVRALAAYMHDVPSIRRIRIYGWTGHVLYTGFTRSSGLASR